MFRAIRDAVVSHSIIVALGSEVVASALTAFANLAVALPWRPNVVFNYFRGGLGTCAVEMH